MRTLLRDFKPFFLRRRQRQVPNLCLRRMSPESEMKREPPWSFGFKETAGLHLENFPKHSFLGFRVSKCAHELEHSNLPLALM